MEVPGADSLKLGRSHSLRTPRNLFLLLSQERTKTSGEDNFLVSIQTVCNYTQIVTNVTENYPRTESARLKGIGKLNQYKFLSSE
jgi:hypothetical protein